MLIHKGTPLTLITFVQLLLISKFDLALELLPTFGFALDGVRANQSAPIHTRSHAELITEPV